MTLIMPNPALVFKRIVKLIKSLGISSKQINAKPKTGKLPQIDIDNVEKEILEITSKVLNKPIKEEVYRVMDLHQQAIEFYSATNDEKYGLYLDKLHSFLNNPIIRSFLDVNDPQKQSVASSSKQKLTYDDKIGNPVSRQISEMIMKQGRNENIELKLRENRVENNSQTEIVETITKKMLHKDGESEEY